MTRNGYDVFSRWMLETIVFAAAPVHPTITLKPRDDFPCVSFHKNSSLDKTEKILK
jgi:hypothetical protein